MIYTQDKYKYIGILRNMSSNRHFLFASFFLFHINIFNINFLFVCVLPTDNTILNRNRDQNNSIINVCVPLFTSFFIFIRFVFNLAYGRYKKKTTNEERKVHISGLLSLPIVVNVCVCFAIDRVDDDCW